MNGDLRKMIVLVILVITTVLIAIGAAGCSNEPKYKIDFGGSEGAYRGAKKAYRAGEQVTLYYDLIATDTDYSFYLDGEPIDFNYDEKKGFVIRFTMPEHDVKLECSPRNSMTYVPQVEQGVLLFDYYYASKAADDDGGYYELTITTDRDELFVYLDEYTKDSDEAEEKNRCYFVPYEVVDECMAIVEQYDMASWNEREDTISIDGAMYVCKFLDGGDLIRVSSDAMPENGQEAFDAVRHVLEGYLQEKNLISEK